MCSSDLKKANPGLYKSVKAQVLGLGYGMGAGRYRETAAKDGIILTEEEAQSTVRQWRTLNPKIVDFWGAFDGDIKAAVLDKSHVLKVEMPTGDYLRHFGIKYWSKEDVDPETGDKVVKRGWESITTQGDYSPNSKQPNLWGGTMTENVTQRMARDVMAEAVLRLEDAGLPVEIGRAHV